MLTLAERVAIVTGAGKGIGRATAIAFARSGAMVVLCGQSAGPLQETQAQIERAGGRAAVLVGDVSSEDVAKESVTLALRQFSRLDFAVNNAGISPLSGNTVECTFETWQRVISVNLTGTWGIVGLTKVAAKEFASKNIRVNAIAPGAIDTPLFIDTIEKGSVKRTDFEKQTPMNRIATADEVAAAAIWLCSDASSYVAGALLPVEGGMTL